MRYSNRVLITLAACLIAVGCDRPETAASQQQNCNCGATNWAKFSPPGEGFSAVMPSRPIATVLTIDTTAGPLVASMFTVEPSNTTAFSVMHNRYPDWFDTTDSKKFFDVGLEKAVGTDGRLISATDIALDGNSGREWKFEKYEGKALVSMRVFLVGHDFYQAICVMHKQRVCEKHVREFLESFELEPDSPSKTAQTNNIGQAKSVFNGSTN